tara:strand:+ start:998 stop:1603 length:606 start_codon:yes stop_codon:yes gene_type:complete
MEQKTDTTNKYDLQDIVASSILEYVKPKHPIYKIQYTHIKRDDDGDDIDIEIRVKEKIVEVVPKFTSKCRRRQEITKEEYDDIKNRAITQGESYIIEFHKKFESINNNGHEHIYPENIKYWKWLDDYYETELEEKKEVLFSHSNSSGKKYYETIKKRLYNDTFTKVSQKYIDLIEKDKRNTYFEPYVEGDKFVITGVVRLA